MMEGTASFDVKARLPNSSQLDEADALHKQHRMEYVKNILAKSNGNTKSSKLSKLKKGDALTLDQLAASPQKVSFTDVATDAALSASSQPKRGKEEEKKDANSLDLQSAFLLKAGEDMELPVVVMLGSKQDAKCNLKYIFSTDQGDVDFTMLHSATIYDDDSGCVRLARDYGPGVMALEPQRRTQATKTAFKAPSP